MWKKVFRNGWNYVHFFGPLVWLFSEMVFAASVMNRNHSVLEAVVVGVTFVFSLTAPFWWEWWDRYKVRYDDMRVREWGSFARALFTSEGKSDKHDLMLGVVGIIIGVGIWVINTTI